MKNDHFCLHHCTVQRRKDGDAKWEHFFSKFTENINSYTVDKKGSESNRIGAILTCEWGFC